MGARLTPEIEQQINEEKISNDIRAEFERNGKEYKAARLKFVFIELSHAWTDLFVWCDQERCRKLGRILAVVIPVVVLLGVSFLLRNVWPA